MRNEIYHHGILGQKWGVRRFQNKDGSLTSAGRKRYDVDIDSAKERVKAAKKNAKATSKVYNKESWKNPFGGPSKKAIDTLNKAKGKVDWEKSKLSDEKAKAGLNRENGKKSKHRLKLEQMYRDKGMSAEEAEIAAYKRSRTEKTIAIIGAATVAAAAAYIAYKHWDKTVDKMIKPGTTLQNISNNSNKGVEDAFYFSMNKTDNTRYRGFYGLQLSDEGDVYETKIGVRNGLKVASPKHAQQVLEEMVTDSSENKRLLVKRLNDMRGRTSDGGNKVIEDAISDLRNNKVSSKVYKALNIGLVYDESLKDTDALRKNFYSALTNKGYDAIMDVNDKKYSGFMSRSPMIAFNASGKAVIDSSRKLDEIEIMDNVRKAQITNFVKQYATKQLPVDAAYATAGIGIAALVKNNKRRKRDKIVDNYRKEHPNTKLSYNEIVDLHYNS